MRKILLLLLVLIAVCVIGCKKDDSGLTTIELWYGASVTEAGPPPANWKVYDILREKHGIKLVLSMLPSTERDQDSRINAAAAANTLPDIFMVRRDPFVTLVRIGAVAPVDHLYDLMPIRTANHYNADSRRFTTINGKSYGLASPGTIEKNEGMLIRKDWLDKHGLSVPVTLDDYYNVMRSFTLNDPDGNGRNDTYGYGAFIELNNFEAGIGRRLDPFFGAFGVAGTWNLTKENAGLNVRKPAYFDALSYIKKLVDNRVIDPNWLSYGKDDFRAAWKQGRFGIMREQNAAFAAENNYTPFDANFPNGEWIVIDPPMGPNGYQSVGVYVQAYRIYAVSAKAMRQGKGDAIAKLLEWMSSDEGYYLLGWGEEGVNFVFNNDGIPVYDGLPDPALGTNKPDMVNLTQLRNMVFYNSGMELISRYPTYKTASGRSMSSYTVLRDMQSRPWTQNIGADALPSPGADLQRFYEQGVIEFLNGTRQFNRESWNAWLTEFDRLGGADWEKAGIVFADENGYLW